MGGGGGGQPGTGDSQVGNTGGTTGITGAVIPPPPAWANLGVNTQQGYNTLMQTQAPGATAAQKGQAYNSLLSQGFGNEAIRSSADTLFGKQSDVDWNSLVQQGGMQAPGGRPLAGSAQFYQPVYQPQYQDLNTGNRMGVSQFGQTPNMFGMQTPFNFGGQMMGGGYGQFGMNNPFSAYSNSFLNMPSDLQGATPEQKADVYRDAMSRGFNDTQMRSQATGLYGPQSNQAWGYLQGLSMGMTPALGQGTMQNKVDFYNQARNQGYSDSVIRNAANQMIGQQGQSDWSYLQNQAARMPQMQTPFQRSAMDLLPPTQPTFGPTPLPNYVRDTISDLDRYQSQPVPAYQPQVARSSGPASRIVSRSSQARGTPNVMRRAEGGIASLVDDE